MISKKEYQREWMRAWRKENLARVRALARKSYYKNLEKAKAKNRRNKWKKWGLDPKEVESLLSRHTVCEICGQQDKLVIDHDHSTNKLRGALCRKCNTGIGLLGDNAALCQRAAEYLRRSQ